MRYDVVVAGGGLAGAALSKALAEQGLRILIVERTQTFKDRVRGEGMHPWGVVEAQALGLYEPLLDTCAREIRYWTTSFGPPPGDRRDLLLTTPHGTGTLAFFHPEMQETMLHLAQTAGAEVRRGTAVAGVSPGPRPAIVVEYNGHCETIQARLVVGADGRYSNTREWAGFRTAQDEKRLLISGLLVEGLAMPEDSVQVILHPPRGQATLIFPIGRQRFRVYLIYRRDLVGQSLSGRRHVDTFLAASIETGAPQAWFEAARPAGPLATFSCADTWVEHPYRNSVVLIGDAAASPNPIWGCGLSLSLRDVRVLRDELLWRDDWREGALAYAAAHDGYYGALRRIEGWLTRLLFEVPFAEDGSRIRIRPRQVLGPVRGLDIVGLGPESLVIGDAHRG